MTTFRSFFILEFKRLFLSWRNWVVFGLFLVLSLYLVNVGIQQYKDMEKRKKEFRNLERQKVEQIVHYDQYGLYGFRLYFMPCPMSTLFYNSSHFTELTCRIDSGEKLNIYGLFKGKKIFEEKPGKLLDFSGIILILGSFMTLFYGFDAFRYREYIKLLSSLYGHRHTFLYIWLSRAILLCAFFIGVALLAGLLLIINSIKITSNGLEHLLIFFAIMLMMQVFFFTLGTFAGSFKSRLMAGLLIILAWMLSVYFIPAILNKVVEAKVKKMLSYYQVELNKLTILMGFEAEVKERVVNAGKERRRQINEEMARRYLEKEGEFERIQNIEKELLAEMNSDVDFFQGLFSLFPTTFYLSTGNELSSRGYANIITFYKNAINIKAEYLQFYVDHRYGENPNKIVNFIEDFKEKQQGKKEANVFHARCQLPGNFGLGIFASFFWLFLSFIASYWKHRNYLFSTPEDEIEGLSALEVELQKGVSSVVLCSSKKTMSNHLYNALLGKGKSKGFTGKLLIDDKNVVEEKIKNDFVYLCQPEQLPGDIKAKHFIKFIAKTLKLSAEERKKLITGFNQKDFHINDFFNKIPEREKGRILLRTVLLKKSDIYMFHDFARGMPLLAREVIDQIKKLKESDASILYITNDVFLGRKVGDFVTFLKKDEALMAISL